MDYKNKYLKQFIAKLKKVESRDATLHHHFEIGGKL